jgi:16S rRNA U516 pseudouridylate synthase RsuA-like enzyme
VAGLSRVDFAGLTLEGLKTGEWRYLNKKEIESLRARIAGPTRRRAVVRTGIRT